MFNMEELDLLHKKNGEILDSTEWNTLVGVINYIIEFYNHYPTKLSEFENDIVGLFIGPKGDKGDQGEKGDKGDTGEQGPKGQDGTVSFAQLTNEQRESLRGPQGVQGELGIQGILGEQGIQGIQGEKGDPFTYNDFTPELLEGLRGPLGIQGPQGELGIQGILGETGATGQDGHSPVITASKNGSVTTISVDGTAIATINDGQNGLKGTNGLNGQDGLNGTSAYWFTGTDVTGIGNNISANINNSKAGDMYLNTSTYNVYTATAANKWNYVCNIRGASGLNGTNGTNGTDGVTPHIDSTTGNWFIGTTNTGIHAQGPAGLNGTNGTNGNNGITPHIDSTTGNWFIGSTDTGVPAQGPAGQDGDVAGLILADWNQSDDTQVSYIRNKPTIPDAQILSDWNESDTTSKAYIANKPTIPTVPTNVSSFTNDAGYLMSHLDISGKANSSDLATVATSGSYTDLINKPTIPTKLSNLQNDLIVPQTNGHEYVEIGGIKWATMNIGATSKTDIGRYFTWGGIDGYTYQQILSNFHIVDRFNPSEDRQTYTKYNSIDNLTMLELLDDAARIHWGNLWRIPSDDDFYALQEASTLSWVTNYLNSGVDGMLYTSKQDNSITLFFPKSSTGSYANYWTNECSSYEVERAYGRTYSSSYGGMSGINYKDEVGYIRPILDSVFLNLLTQIDWNLTDPTSLLYIKNKPTIPQIWSGTQALYDAIATPDANTIYIITSAS